MITYATEFPIASANSVEDVLALACEWILGSPHTKINADALQIPSMDCETRTIVEDERVVCALTKGPGFTMAGVQYVLIDRKPIECEWTTSIVAYRTPDKHILSVQVSCESTGVVSKLPWAKKPYFVRQALKKLGTGMDGSIPVTDQAFVLTEEEVKIAADIINGTAGNRLPIIYVSAEYDGSHAIAPLELAKWVSGLAHVFVEPSRAFSAVLRDMTASRNPYGGSIAVYWPESNARKSYYIGEDKLTGEEIQIAIARDIQAALSNRRQTSTCNWLYLKEVISRAQYENLKATGSLELNDYISAFDSEIKAKDQRLTEAEEEIARLNAELRKHAVNQHARSSGFLNAGKEQNFYKGEIKDIVVESLIEAQKQLLPETRRAHILADIILSNPLDKQGEVIAQEVKSLLKGYVNMNAKVKGGLTTLGFDVTDDGKHYKAVYQGDGRYTFSISKTSSDHRSGLNTASDINKALY